MSVTVFHHICFRTKLPGIVVAYVRYVCNNISWIRRASDNLDFKYLCDRQNAVAIAKNVKDRKGIGNINLVHELQTKLNTIDITDENYENLRRRFHEECLKIPNSTHPMVVEYGNDPRRVKIANKQRIFDFVPRKCDELFKRLNMTRVDGLGPIAGSRAYYLLGELAEVEHALVKHTLKR